MSLLTLGDDIHVETSACIFASLAQAFLKYWKVPGSGDIPLAKMSHLYFYFAIHQTALNASRPHKMNWIPSQYFHKKRTLLIKLIFRQRTDLPIHEKKKMLISKSFPSIVPSWMACILLSQETTKQEVWLTRHAPPVPSTMLSTCYDDVEGQELIFWVPVTCQALC